MRFEPGRAIEGVENLRFESEWKEGQFKMPLMVPGKMDLGM